MRAVVIWSALALVVAVPLILAAASPLLAFRQPVYIAAGFAGILGLGLLVVQPLLAAGALPGLGRVATRKAHRWIGAGVVAVIVVHIVGLWIFSPPDVIDALLLRSPTPFSAWGVLAMWAIFAAAGLALLRRKLGVPPLRWRRWHTSLAIVTVAGTVVHALLIEGTMEPVSKVVLCAVAFGATLKSLIDLKIWRRR